VQSEIREMSAAWKELLTTMQSVRGGIVITGPAKVEAALEVKAVEESFEEVVVEEEEEEVEETEPEEEKVEETEPEEEKVEELEEREDLIQKILGLIGDHPEGLRMVEIGEKLEIESWRSLIPVMRELLDDEEVRKEDSTYFIA
jgi:acetylornithine deacetylase/succinyl-diaminopimelate desuccinylase-like protein